MHLARRHSRPASLAMPALLAAALLLRPAAAGAQTILMTLDGGQRTDTHLNGVDRTGYFGTVGMSLVLGGAAGKNAALIVPITGEMRMATNSYMDLNLFTDAALRLGPLTGGAGLVMSWDDIPDVPDEVAEPGEDAVTVSNPIAFGYSLFSKLNFGPQGRMFLQGRFAALPAAYAWHYIPAESAELASENGVTIENVPQQDSYMVRAALGYTWGGKMVRLQYTQERWRYDRVLDNSTGAYDRDVQMISLGLTFF